MIVYLEKNKFLFVRFFLILFLIFPAVLFLNSGFLADGYWKMVQALILAVELAAVLVWSKLKMLIFFEIAFLFASMGLFYIFGLVDIADMTGSTAFGLLILNISSYLPQIVKLGYIKNL